METPEERKKRLKKARNDKFNAANPGYHAKAQAKFFLENPEAKQEYRRRYRATRPEFRIACSLRSRIQVALKRALANKSNNSITLLGCSAGFYRNYLETLFQPGMSWENYGDWHIDHILPLTSFDLTDKAQQLVAFNFKNTQPLWAFDNLSKGAKLPDLQE
jgi:hypothetical protein